MVVCRLQQYPTRFNHSSSFFARWIKGFGIPDILPASEHFGKGSQCDVVTTCTSVTMDRKWVGDVQDCAALCANFAFTNFTSSTCHKAVLYPGPTIIALYICGMPSQKLLNILVLSSLIVRSFS
jgi:hypothetical protein